MTLSDDTLKNAIGEARAKWGWFVALGVLLLIFGGIAFGNLFLATVASVYLVGWLMLLGGIVEIIHAFGVKSWGRFFYWLLSGLLYAFAGFFAFYNPLLASAVLTFLLAVSPDRGRASFEFGWATATGRTAAGAGSSLPASSPCWSAFSSRCAGPPTACGCSACSWPST